MTTSTWEAEARQEPRLSGAGCTEMGTSRSNREGRDLIVSLDLTTQVLTQRDSRSLTIAVESGSDRLRQIVNKKLTTPEIAQAAINAKTGGFID
jgi:radical SAM superfamily enzyme YgiQ (UPF0313 family)